MEDSDISEKFISHPFHCGPLSPGMHSASAMERARVHRPVGVGREEEQAVALFGLDSQTHVARLVVEAARLAQPLRAVGPLHCKRRFVRGSRGEGGGERAK